MPTPWRGWYWLGGSLLLVILLLTVPPVAYPAATLLGMLDALICYFTDPKQLVINLLWSAVGLLVALAAVVLAHIALGWAVSS